MSGDGYAGTEPYDRKVGGVLEREAYDPADAQVQRDLQRRAAENRQKAIDAGQAVAIPPEVAAKIGRARTLQTELAGYQGLSPQVKANPNVAETIHPKIAEYTQLRLELAVWDVVSGLRAELGDFPAALMPRLEMVGAPGTEVEVRQGTGQYQHVADVRVGAPVESDLVVELRRRATEAAKSGDLDQVDRLIKLALASRDARL